MSYLRFLCLFAYNGVQHILCCVFCLVCLRLVCPSLNALLGILLNYAALYRVYNIY
jgi:hypothetical protein